VQVVPLTPHPPRRRARARLLKHVVGNLQPGGNKWAAAMDGNVQISRVLGTSGRTCRMAARQRPNQSSSLAAICR
jgi:hypothetical protein